MSAADLLLGRITSLVVSFPSASHRSARPFNKKRVDIQLVLVGVDTAPLV